MPIRAENRALYPADWPAISAFIRFVRAAGRCEWPGCAAVHGEAHPVTGSAVVLTVAHLDHDPPNCRPDNLLALCQRCHLAYDAPLHAANRRATLRARRAAGDLFEEVR